MNQQDMEEAVEELRKGFDHIWNALGKALSSSLDTFKEEMSETADKVEEKVTNIKKASKAKKK